MAYDLNSYSEILEEAAHRWLRPSVANGVIGRRPYLIAADAAGNAPFNVHGVGIGYKVVAGQPTGALAMRFHVIQKLPDELVPEQYRIPSELRGMPTDVLESTVAVLGGVQRERRPSCSGLESITPFDPLVAGVAIGPAELIGEGTLGWFCRSTLDGEADSRFMLSNNHVLARFNDGRQGDAIFQPPDGKRRRHVAHLHRWIDLVRGAGKRNVVDAAIAKLIDPNPSLSIRELGRPGRPATPELGMSVVKRGVGTCLTRGRITDYPMIRVVSVNQPDGAFCEFERQIQVTSLTGEPFIGEADSGALLLREGDLAPVGLLFAKAENDGRTGFANPIEEVTAALHVELL